MATLNPHRRLRRAALELVFILVEPARAENIGAAARALKTMGFSQLWLVNAGELPEPAWWVAHQSGEVLDQARHFDSLEHALAEVDFSIATCARRRLERDRYLSPAHRRDALQRKAGRLTRAAPVLDCQAKLGSD